MAIGSANESGTLILCVRAGKTGSLCACSDFIWDYWKLPFPSHLGKYIVKNAKISTKIHEIGKVKAIF